MKIEIKKINLKNFKGIKDKEIQFANETFIYGENATGKTTIFDAFTWLLFGKDSTDRKDFGIKTRDKNGDEIPKVEHEVSAILSVDGKDIELKRVLKERWQKKRGAEEAEFTGNETLFFWNDVPLQAGEFQAKINDLIGESLFKLITNPLYFSSLKWQDRRAILTSLAGNITDAEIAENNNEFKELLTGLGDKSLEDFKKEISVKKKKLNDEIKTIPARIDEVRVAMPENIDFKSLNQEYLEISEQVNILDEQITNENKALEAAYKAKNEVQARIYDVKSELQRIEFEEKQKATNAVDEYKSNINRLELSLANKKQDKTTGINAFNNLVNRKAEGDSIIINLREQWIETNAGELSFNENEFHCPTCQREFESSKIEEKKALMKSNFEKNKAEKLANIDSEGKRIKSELEELNIRISKGKQYVDDLEEQINLIETQLAEAKNKTAEPVSADISNPKYNILIEELKSLDQQVAEVPNISIDNLKSQKRELLAKLDLLKLEINKEQDLKKSNSRIAELNDLQKNYAQQLAELERKEFTMQNFIKAKMEAVESNINNKFQYVKFKMFETQVNGQEIESCITLVDGVPFEDANNAARINSGLDIINTLSSFHKTTAPVFIDNRESVNRLIFSQSQIINMLVSLDKSLRVETNKKGELQAQN